jgi:superfamily II DNA helicase RecQ
VSASRIRFYQTAGLLAPDGRTATGYWVYGESAVQALREKLTAIEELQERLSRTKSKLREVIDDIESAQCCADHVDRIIASLGLAVQPLAAHDVLSGVLAARSDNGN